MRTKVVSIIFVLILAGCLEWLFISGLPHIYKVEGVIVGWAVPVLILSLGLLIGFPIGLVGLCIRWLLKG